MFSYTMVMTVLWLANVITYDQYKIIGLIPFVIYGIIVAFDCYRRGVN